MKFYCIGTLFPKRLLLFLGYSRSTELERTPKLKPLHDKQKGAAWQGALLRGGSVVSQPLSGSSKPISWQNHMLYLDNDPYFLKPKWSYPFNFALTSPTAFEAHFIEIHGTTCVSKMRKVWPLSSFSLRNMPLSMMCTIIWNVSGKLDEGNSQS